MKFHKGRGEGNSLMQVAAAVVGSAAASQHIPAGPPDDDPYPDPGCPKRTGNASNFCLLEAGHEGACDDEPNPDLLRQIARLKARVAELEQAGPTAALDVHQALNTYEVAADVPPGVLPVAPHMAMVIGANHRKLIARWDTDGVWLGGCLIADREHAEALAAFITREEA